MPTITDIQEQDFYAIHIGIHKDHLDSAVTALRKRPEFESVSAALDGWEAWGEAPDEDENAANPDARHVVIHARYYESAITAVDEAVGTLLIPMVTERQKGFVLSVSATHDWSIEIDDGYTSL